MEIEIVGFWKELGASVLVTQSSPTLCDPMGSKPLDSSIHGVLQARIQECVAIPFSRTEIIF